MLTIDIVVLKTENTDPIDEYRTIRSLEAISSPLLPDSQVCVHVSAYTSIKELELNSTVCMFLIAGDLIEDNFIDCFVQNFISSEKIILQPSFSYGFDKSNRVISKNIDLHAELASYDVLSIRYFASRHFISKTNEFNNFISEIEEVSSNILWSYLIYLLSNEYILMCLPNTISFEISDPEFNNRFVKTLDSVSAPLPVCSGFNYEEVLRRQNINNINVVEKKTGVYPNLLKKAQATQPKKNEANIVSKAINIEPPGPGKIAAQKKVSEYTISEAIESDGLLKGLNLTTSRILKRASQRLQRNDITLKDKISQTKNDIKTTLNLE